MDRPGQYAILDIKFRRREASEYTVELRFSLPEKSSEVEFGLGKPGTVQFDIPSLTRLENKPEAYGRKLSEFLFADKQVRDGFVQAKASAKVENMALRLRLEIDPLAANLHSLRWETLRDPQDSSPISTNENILFSRYLTGLDWMPVRPRSEREGMPALVVIANPTDLGAYGMAPIDVDEEIQRIKKSLMKTQPDTLPGNRGSFASLDNMMSCLRSGDYELLYLVCHGRQVGEVPYLFLQDEHGEVVRVSGADLVERLRELPRRPRLAILASCQSAGKGRASDQTAQVLTALGPRLSEAGIPAVIAIQGNLSMKTAERFFPEFFHQLDEDGQIDRAITVARGKVRDRFDFWMPALFMRLKSGRGWYTPGIGEAGHETGQWIGLLDRIQKGMCTPILGPGMFEPMFGSLRQIAHRWALKHNYPLAPYEKDSLPQVAQYLAVTYGWVYPIEHYTDSLREDIQKSYPKLPLDLLDSKADINALIHQVHSNWIQDKNFDTYQMLASLDLPVYVTTNLNDLMATALREAGKDPVVILCPWKKFQEVNTPSTLDPGYVASPERPLVYHLYGRLGDDESIVLTEDDYLNYLKAVIDDKEIIPSIVRSRFSRTLLLFLGFQPEEWIFRILLHSLLNPETVSSRIRFKHISAQIEPDEDRFLEPESARKYLDEYFKESRNIVLYWGSTVDFLKELKNQRQKPGSG